MKQLAAPYIFVALQLFLPLSVYSRPDFQSRFKRSSIQNDPSQSCSSLVYCQGRLLDTVQRARVFSDSKTFVDLSQINSEQVTLQNFDQLMTSTSDNPSKEQLLEFVNANFEDSSELVNWTPEDYSSSPAFLGRIIDQEIRQFASDLVGIWPTLGRKIGASVFEDPAKHSLIGVPNGIIIPGGRFKEFYYWDSYWIIEGLLLSEMYDTAKGMIENLLYMVEQYGFVPNGGRVYYLNRSQPPLLTLMAGIYFDKTGNVSWIQENIGLLDKELTYWIEEKTIEVVKNNQKYRMARYFSESTTPRPESYYEDVSTCAYFGEEENREHCYQGLKSGAESGWDFSSRWFFDQEGGVKTNLTHIDAQRVIPVDLNAFLCNAFKRLSSFYSLLGDAQKAAKWELHSQHGLQAIEKVLYNEQDGIWYDFDPMLSKPRKMFFPSNFAPLWTESYNLAKREYYGRRAAAYFIGLRIGEFKGGIPASLDDNNEQWDLPNAWPPLQEFVILGMHFFYQRLYIVLEQICVPDYSTTINNVNITLYYFAGLWNTGNRKAKRVARRSARRWIEANLRGFKEQNAMFEKYDSTRVGQYGGGGEYEVQKGFGWTNGVALNLINQFYTGSGRDLSNEIDIDDDDSNESKESHEKENGSKEKGDKSNEKHDKSHEKDDKSNEKHDKSHEKDDKSNEKEDKSHEKGNKSHEKQ